MILKFYWQIQLENNVFERQFFFFRTNVKETRYDRFFLGYKAMQIVKDIEHNRDFFEMQIA